MLFNAVIRMSTRSGLRHFCCVFVVQLALTLLTSPQISPEMQTGERQQLLRDRFSHLRRDVCLCFRRAWEGPVGTMPRTCLT